MHHSSLTQLIFLAGLGQVTILIASALVPFRLNWRHELRGLSRLHRQMHWVYGGYVVLSIIAFATLSICNSDELAGGSGLARGFCAYVAVFWGIRLALQAIFDIKEYLNTWWTKAGYFALTLMFAAFTIVYSWAALRSVNEVERSSGAFIQPLCNVVNGILIKGFIEFARDETDVRRSEYVFQTSKRVVSRQWLGIENIDRGAGNASFAQCLQKSSLLNDRPARRIDEPR
jgi:hypothetical protein